MKRTRLLIGIIVLLTISCILLLINQFVNQNQGVHVYNKHCSPWRNVIGYNALCTELTNVCNCATDNCSNRTTTVKASMALTDVNGTSFTFPSNQSIPVTTQNDVIVAANNWSNANRPAGYYIFYTKYLPAVIVGPGQTVGGIYIEVTYAQCNAIKTPAQ